jgi:hypothetical protein
MAANVTKRLAEAYYTVEGGLVVLRDHPEPCLRARTHSLSPAHCCARPRSRRTLPAQLGTRSWGSRDQPFSAALINSMLLK